VYNTRNYWFYGFYPSPGTLKSTKEYNVQKLDLFPSQVGGGAPTLFRPLESANL
jgi:hypothetical protein